MRGCGLFFLLFCLCLPCSGFALTGEEIIARVEDNLNGETAELTISMEVVTSRTRRTMEMDSFSIGGEKSFIRITSPKKDRGITFLKINNGMWQYVPKIERIIKIPSSMMLQSWMGSDFTNDDLVKESSLGEDYTATLLDETENYWRLQLLPHENAPVVWGRIVMEVSKKYFLPGMVEYYDEDGILVRHLSYDKIERFGKRYYPTKWTMVPQGEMKKGHQTIVTIKEAAFDGQIGDHYFTKRALKRFSR